MQRCTVAQMHTCTPESAWKFAKFHGELRYNSVIILLYFDCEACHCLVRFANCIVYYQSRGWGPWLAIVQCPFAIKEHFPHRLYPVRSNNRHFLGKCWKCKDRMGLIWDGLRRVGVGSKHCVVLSLGPGEGWNGRWFNSYARVSSDFMDSQLTLGEKQKLFDIVLTSINTLR